MVRTGGVLIAVALLVIGTGAQQRLAFEVASARLVLDMNFGTDAPFQFANVVTDERVHLVDTLRSFLQRALRVKDYQLVAPDWTNGWLVEIRGTFPPGATKEDVPEMLHTLLIQRFGLVTHAEARTMDAYQMVADEGGIRMRQVEAMNDLDRKFDDVHLTASGPADRTTQTVDGPVRTMNAPGIYRRITSRTMYERTTGGASDGATINAIRMTMSELASILTPNLGEPVLDRTGLTGIYQFTIALPEDEASRSAILVMRRVLRERRGLPPGHLTDDRRPATAATLKAVEGLGLKLERRRLPADVVVVDSIQRQPTDN